MANARQIKRIFDSAVAAIEASARAAGATVPHFPEVPRETLQALRALPLRLYVEAGQTYTISGVSNAALESLVSGGLAHLVPRGSHDVLDRVAITPAGESLLAKWDAAFDWEWGTSFAAADVVEAFELEQDKERAEVRRARAKAKSPLGNPLQAQHG